MYNEYFGFKQAPFSIAPDPRYLYMTEQHRDALAHLVYGLNSEGGCILLTGEVGTGKTTICRCLLEQIPEQAKVALVLNPKVSEIELLETICDELDIDYPETNNSAKTYTDRIYKFLIESNRKNEKIVLIIDEAQNLDSEVLEQLRLLTNLETDQRKLLQIIILGQPELLDILAKNEMRQLAQRITARFHLQPLDKHEVKAYVDHRLAVAGQNIRLFPDSSIKLLFKLSKGVPRLINIICDRSLLGAYVENQYAVDTRTMKKAAKEVFGELKNIEQHNKNKRWLAPVIAGTALLCIAVAGAFYLDHTNIMSDIEPVAIIDEIEDEMIEIISEDDGHDQITYLDEEPASIGQTEEIGDSDTIIDTDNMTNETDDYSDLAIILDTENSDQTDAYQRLFAAWNKEYDSNSGKTACNQAKELALRCLFKKGNLNSLKTYNRPAILSLFNSKGEPRYVTLTSISGDSATIYVNNTRHEVTLSQLDQHWFGAFTLLWQKPTAYTSAITPGERGEIINWLNTQISKINHSNLDMIVSTYDQRLINKVKTFQTQQGLTADGIVGPVTIIHLNTQAGLNVPTLNRQG